MESTDKQKDAFVKNIQSRIKEFVDKRAKSINRFERDIGVTQRTIRNVIEGKNLPSVQTIYALKKHYPELDLNWLISEEESVSIVSEPQSAYTNITDQELLKKYNELRYENSCLKDKLIKLYEKQETTDN
jgi:transcriptional regulator with XRE-family HTH domain